MTVPEIKWHPPKLAAFLEQLAIHRYNMAKLEDSLNRPPGGYSLLSQIGVSSDYSTAGVTVMKAIQSLNIEIYTAEQYQNRIKAAYIPALLDRLPEAAKRDYLSNGGASGGRVNPDDVDKIVEASKKSNNPPMLLDQAVDMDVNYRAVPGTYPFPTKKVKFKFLGMEFELDVPQLSPEDLHQGGLGDCYFLSALGAAASTPEGKAALVRNLKDNGDGTYTVTFYDDKGNPVQVTVDDTYVTDPGGNPVYSGHPNTDPNSKWIWIYEKAWAKYYKEDGKNDGFETASGGWPDYALRALTGKSADKTEIPKTDPAKDPVQARTDQDKILTTLQDAANNQQPVTVVSYNTPDDDYNGHPLPDYHVWVVTGVDQAKREVTLINPWDGKPFTMPIDIFVKNYGQVVVGGK